MNDREHSLFQGLYKKTIIQALSLMHLSGLYPSVKRGQWVGPGTCSQAETVTRNIFPRKQPSGEPL